MATNRVLHYKIIYGPLCKAKKYEGIKMSEKEEFLASKERKCLFCIGKMRFTGLQQWLTFHQKN